MEVKQHRFECLHGEFQQDSHTFQQALWAFQWVWGGITHLGSEVQKQNLGISLDSSWETWMRSDDVFVSDDCLTRANFWKQI